MSRCIDQFYKSLIVHRVSTTKFSTIINLSSHLPYVDTRVPLTKCMSISELCHNCDRIETRILRESRRDNFQCIGIGLETVCFHTG